jgi:hypothetical protein
MNSVLDRKYHKIYLHAAAAVLFLLITVKQIVFSQPGLEEYKAIGTIILMFYEFIIFLLLFKNTLIEKLIWWGIYVFGIVIMELVTVFLLSTIMGKSLEELSQDDMLTAYIVVTGKLMALLLFEIIIRSRRDRLIIGFSYSRELTIVIVLNILLVPGFVFSMNNKPNIIKNIDYVIILFFGIVMLITLYTAALIFRIEKKSSEELETKLKLQQAELELKLNNDMENVTDRLRKLRHDMNNHIGLIKTLAKAHRYEELEEYIDDLYEDIDAANELVIIDNKALSVLINTKKSLAKARNIEFESIIAIQDFNMNNKDMCTLIGNILDNAMEAADKSEGRKYIHLTIMNAPKGCEIICENSFSVKPVVVNSRFQTTKENAGIHGIGMENIRDIAKKYSGEVHFNFEDETFNVNVILPI